MISQSSAVQSLEIEAMDEFTRSASSLKGIILAGRRRIAELVEAFKWARIKRQATRKMAHSSNHMLKDIGMTREQIDARAKDLKLHKVYYL